MILNLFHLKENVNNYAKAMFSNDSTKVAEWAKPICEKLEDGKWKEVLQILHE